MQQELRFFNLILPIIYYIYCKIDKTMQTSFYLHI